MENRPHKHAQHSSAVTRRELLRGLVFASGKPQKESDTHTLVVVFLRGGADTLNILVPYGDDTYYRMRPTLAIKPTSGESKSDQQSIKLDGFYALHPAFSPMERVFKEGRLACVQAVGSDNSSGSHFSAQDQIEHGEAEGQGLTGGWLGRHLRVMAGASEAGASPLSAVAIGSALPESLRGAPAASVFESVQELQMSLPAGEDPKRVAGALARMYGAEVGVLGERGGQTLELLKRVEKLRSAGPAGETGSKGSTPGGGAMMESVGIGGDSSAFSRGLTELAGLIKADVGLQVGCIDLPGWDTHFVQGGREGLQAGLITQLANGLAGFDARLGSHRSRVTTVVMTEFGRRLYENASLGTDHGRGFCMFVMGGQVAGGRVIGAWPGFEEMGFGAGDLPGAGPGGLKVVTDYRVVLGEVLAKAAGNRSVDKVFPGFQGRGVGVIGARV